MTSIQKHIALKLFRTDPKHKGVEKNVVLEGPFLSDLTALIE